MTADEKFDSMLQDARAIVLLLEDKNNGSGHVIWWDMLNQRMEHLQKLWIEKDQN